MRAGQFFQKHQGDSWHSFFEGSSFCFLCGTVNFLIQIFDGLLQSVQILIQLQFFLVQKFQKLPGYRLILQLGIPLQKEEKFNFAEGKVKSFIAKDLLHILHAVIVENVLVVAALRR